MSLFISKSDFKVAQDCPTKLFYKKQGYPSTVQDDEYLEMLAEGGFMIEKMAKLLFPEGKELPVTVDYDLAARQTMAALAEENVTLFEATFVGAGKLARVDVLIKRGDEFQIIEAKANHTVLRKTMPRFWMAGPICSVQNEPERFLASGVSILRT